MNAQCTLGRSALVWASGLGHASVVKMLLNSKNNVELDLFDYNGYTALMYTCGKRVSEAAADDDVVRKNQVDIAALLLHRGADANIQNDKEHGFSALMLAADHDLLECVNVLIRFRANPNLKGKRTGFTALIIASFGATRKLQNYYLVHSIFKSTRPLM